MSVEVEWGPNHPEFCPQSKDEHDGEGGSHCSHWWDCEPCCWCGDDTPNPECDCPRCTAVRTANRSHQHVPSIPGLPASKCKECGDGALAGIHRPPGGWQSAWPAGVDSNG